MVLASAMFIPAVVWEIAPKKKEGGQNEHYLNNLILSEMMSVTSRACVGRVKPRAVRFWKVFTLLLLWEACTSEQHLE